MRTPRRREDAASEDAAKEAALRILARGPRTEREVSDRLLERGYTPEAAAGAVERLRRVQLLDDRSFLRAFLRSELTRKPQGRTLLVQTLRRRGIAASLLAELDAVLAGDEDLAERSLATEPGRAACAAAQLRMRYRRDVPDVRRRRMEQGLLRRGFSWDVIRDLLRAESEEPE